MGKLHIGAMSDDVGSPVCLLITTDKKNGLLLQVMGALAGYVEFNHGDTILAVRQKQDGTKDFTVLNGDNEAINRAALGLDIVEEAIGARAVAEALTSHVVAHKISASVFAETVDKAVAEANVSEQENAQLVRYAAGLKVAQELTSLESSVDAVIAAYVKAGNDARELSEEIDRRLVGDFDGPSATIQ